jgi:recombinational DNA repair protein (RecF pathway)
MQEYVTRALVLDKQTRGGHADARYSFFTERYGKIAARAVSSRKITSKLAGHLEPGTLAAVRIIETHGAQVVDALKFSRANISLATLAALNRLLGEWEPDKELWQELVRVAMNGDATSATTANGTAAMTNDMAAEPVKKFSWSNTLAILGWDPRAAVCARCGKVLYDANTPNRQRYFHVPRQEFFCTQCAMPFVAAARAGTRASRFAREELLLV